MFLFITRGHNPSFINILKYFTSVVVIDLLSFTPPYEAILHKTGLGWTKQPLLEAK